MLDNVNWVKRFQELYFMYFICTVKLPNGSILVISVFFIASVEIRPAEHVKVVITYEGLNT